jgi:hypothetical protein
VGPRAILDAVVKRKILCPRWELGENVTSPKIDKNI